MPTVSVNLDTTQYVKVSAALNPIVLQAHRDSVRITLSELKPAKSNSVFHLLGGGDHPLSLNAPDTNIWALASTDRSSLVATELDPSSVSVGNVVDVSETDLTFETDVVTVLTDISDKLGTLLKYWAMFQKVDLEEDC